MGGVRNTFIDTSLGVNLLSQGREVSSCPASKIGRMPKPLALDLDDDHDVNFLPVATPQPWPVTPLESWQNHMSCGQEDTLAHLESLGLATAMFVLPSPDEVLMPPCWQGVVAPPLGTEAMMSTASVLRLAD